MFRRLSCLPAVLAVAIALLSGTTGVAAPSFVQVDYGRVTSGTTSSVSFSGPNTAGNLIMVYVIWDNIRSVSVTDARGNVYTSAGSIQWNGSRHGAQVFYAQNIAGGTNTVTAAFSSSLTSFGILYIHEYAGIDRTSPLGGVAGSVGTSGVMDSGAVTASANDLLFGAGV